jgi:hypothetical protein
MATKEEILMIGKKIGFGAGIGLPLAVIITWMWNSFMPESQMPAEVSAALGSLLTTAVGWIVPS